MIKYSICMCNYNMDRTLKIALESILSQIDERFEIVLVDDGSSDQSVGVVEDMQKSYPNLRLVSLKREATRKLGFARNISIREAAGEYVLLHLDCDDITAPHIRDLVGIFGQIESAAKKDFLLSSRPIQMGKRDFLLQHGPYRNIHRGEDRDMWGRLAAADAVLFLDNKSLKNVLPKSRAEKIYRAFYYTFDHLRNDFRANTRLKTFLYYEIFKQKNFNWKTRAIRAFMTFPAFFSAKCKGALPAEVTMESYEQFADYRSRNSGTFEALMRKYGAESDWSQLSLAAKDYF